MINLISPNMLSSTAVTTAVAIFITAAAFEHWRRNRKIGKSKLPPGPPGLPLIGNIFDFPKENPWLSYKAMSLKYQSDIIHLHALGTSLIVLHDLKSARDLLERRSRIYSDRPRLAMIGELMGWNDNMVFCPYGDFWRASRRALHQEFRLEVIGNYYPAQMRATRELLRRLVVSPDQWRQHLQHQTGRIALDGAYGIDIAPTNDPYIEVIEEAILGVVTSAVPGTFLVDAFPVLRHIPSWMPGAEFKRKAKEWKNAKHSATYGPYNAHTKAQSEGCTKSSYCSRHLNRLDRSCNNDVEESVIRETALVVYGAGTETTFSVLSTFFLAMVLYPEVQRQAQAELDAVIGSGHMPEFGDRESLPYITAIIMECLRWQPVLPIGIPHRLTTDDYYNGYFLPAGSIVAVNSWAILHDEDVYPDPFCFRPERFLKDGKPDPNVQDPGLAAFGYGRRVCPGRHSALQTLFITISSVLTAFTIEKAVDASGNVITPSGRYTSSFSRCFSRTSKRQEMV